MATDLPHKMEAKSAFYFEGNYSPTPCPIALYSVEILGEISHFRENLAHESNAN